MRTGFEAEIVSGAPHIAQVTTSGMAVCVLLLDHIRALEAAGYQVTAICAPGPWAEKARSLGLRVQTIDFRRELSPAADVRALGQLRRLFRRERFDVVHSHTPKAGLLAPLAAQLASVPHVVHTVHGFLFHDQMPRWKQPLFWSAEKFTATFADQLLSQSSEDVEAAVRTRICPARKIQYLGNGIDVASFHPSRGSSDRDALRSNLGIDGKAIVAGTVGRFVYDKGFGELFAAAKRLLQQNPSLHFLMIGGADADQSDAIEEEVLNELRNQGRMHFLDWQEDMSRWYAAMDLFVLPSHREGVPRACMEAAAMELPVVASDIRGCREVVCRGETGLLVPVGDVDALSDAILRIAGDANLRRKMGTLGRQHIVQNFTQAKVLERLLSFYQELVPLERVAGAACAAS